MKSYLLHREQFVGIDGSNPNSLQVLSGVPQGSVLGPLLFITYINHVTDVISQGSKLNMFADDMALYRVIKSTEDDVELQNDINAVSKFMDTKLLQFNLSKCELLFVPKKLSRSLPPPALLLNGSLLQQVLSYRYLRITITSDLSWYPHITTICNKTRKLIGLLYRRFSRNAIPSTLLKLYTTFVRPHVEYASIVWSPHFKNEVDALEKVQRFALRVCLRQWNL